MFSSPWFHPGDHWRGFYTIDGKQIPLESTTTTLSGFEKFFWWENNAFKHRSLFYSVPCHKQPRTDQRISSLFLWHYYCYFFATGHYFQNHFKKTKREKSVRWSESLQVEMNPFSAKKAAVEHSPNTVNSRISIADARVRHPSPRGTVRRRVTVYIITPSVDATVDCAEWEATKGRLSLKK